MQPLKPLNEYITIQENDEGRFYVVHFDGELFYCGEDDDGIPVWSDNLQDSAIYCRESAEIIMDEFSGSTFDPISVDLNVVA